MPLFEVDVTALLLDDDDHFHDHASALMAVSGSTFSDVEVSQALFHLREEDHGLAQILEQVYESSKKLIMAASEGNQAAYLLHIRTIQAKLVPARLLVRKGTY